MKTTTFICLFFSVVPFFYGTAEAQYTSIPDINFENYLETNGMGDGVYGNGLVLTHKIDTLKVLNVPQKNISNFSGIEDFISLEFFNATLNPVSSLDLSNNTNIELLGCEYCLNLHYLDLSTLTKLKHIAVQRSGLNNLILGSKPDLRILEVFESYLTSIDLSQCPVLKELYIQDQDNYLTGLDISQNLELEILYCGMNELTGLDTSNNSNLGVVGTGHVKISSYDFSQNPKIFFFSEGHNNSLSYVDMRNGHNEIVTSFFIVQCHNLKCVYVDDPSASYLEDWYVDTPVYFVADEQECAALTTRETSESKLLLYPNPVKDRLKISNPDFLISGIEIRDVSGKIIQKQAVFTNEIEVDLSSLPAGVYYISAESNGSKFKTGKIIKK